MSGSHGKHTADYYRNRRAQQRKALERAGTPLRGYGDFAQSPPFVARGRELAAMLEWPADLFGQNMTIAELMADGDFAPAKIGRVPDESKCACGCGQPHNHAVSRVTGSDSPYGYTRKVVWYRNMHCRNKHMGLVK